MNKKIKNFTILLWLVSFVLFISSLLRVSFLINENLFKSYFLLGLIIIFSYFSFKKIISTNFKEIKRSKIEKFIEINSKYISYILIFIFIICLSIIRYRFFNVSFTTDHPMKYAAYVEPALFMVKNNSPFWYQKKYYLNDVQNLNGEKLDLNHLPLIEWFLAAGYASLPFTVEFTTRLILHLFLVANLLLMFFYLKKYIGNFSALFITFAVGLNPIVNFSHYVTVIDSILMTVTFSSLIFLNKYFKNKKIVYLEISALVLGIGSITKSSVFLWTFPIFFILNILKNKNNLKIATINIVVFTFFSLAQFLPLFLVVFKYPHETMLNNILATVLWIFANLFLFRVINDKFIKKISELDISKLIVIVSMPIFIILFLLFSLKTEVFNYLNEFATGLDLVFYYPMYHKIFEKLGSYVVFKPMLILATIQAVLSIYLIAKNKYKNEDKLVLSFFFSFLFYLVIASKVIFIHNYYNIFLIIPVLILSFSLIFKAINLFPLIFKVFILLFVLLFMNKSKNELFEIMSFYRINYSEINGFIKENINEYNRSIYNINTYSYYAPIIDSGEINGNQILESKTFVNNLKLNGLRAALIKYNLLYFIQEKDEDDPISFFKKMYLEKNNIEKLDRNEIIKGFDSEVIENKNFISDSYLIDVDFELTLETNNFFIYKLK